MGYLQTFSVYLDDADRINENKKEFAEEIYDACCNPNTNYRTNVFHGLIIPQKARHADNKMIYMHAGNTVVEMSLYSDITQELMRNSPKFFEEMLKHMEYNVKELKKQFKELKTEKK